MEENNLNSKEKVCSDGEKKKEPSLLFICSFLSIEVLAFTTFGLGNNFAIYGLLGFVLALCLMFICINEIKMKQISNYLFLGIPLIVYSFLTAISPLANANYITTQDRIFLPFALFSFSVSGYLFAYKKSIKLKHVFLGIYSALFLFTSITFFYNMIQFEPFYTFIYNNGYIFYDGKPSIVPVGKMAFSLMGFSMQEISIEAYSIYPFLLSTSLISLFIINPKKETKLFILYASYAFIGIMCLIFMANKFTLITDFLLMIIILILVLIHKKIIKMDIFKKIVYVLEGLFIFYLLFFLILSQSKLTFLEPLRNFLYNIPLLGKLFSFGRYKVAIDGIFTKNQIFGFYDSYADPYSSDSILFDAFISSGLLGGLAIGFIIFFSINVCLKYLQKEENDYKFLLVCFVISYFVYSFLNGDSTPYINYANVILQPMSGLFLVTCFLVGYALFNVNIFKKDKKVNIEEKIEVMKNE